LAQIAVKIAQTYDAKQGMEFFKHAGSKNWWR